MRDLRASIVVFLVALPLCLGIALASDAPLAAGILAGVVGGLIVGALGGSPVSVSGPAAGLTVIVAAAIHELGSFPAFLTAVVLAGVLQFALGVVRAGRLGDYFPSPVIHGMLAAIGVILVLKQLPHLVGVDADWMGDEAFVQPDGENTFSELFRISTGLHPGAALVGVLSLGAMVAWDRFVQGRPVLAGFPGALVAVIVGVLLNELVFPLDPALVIEASHRVTLPFTGGIGGFLGAIQTPDVAALTNPATWRVAATLALVASIESLLSVDAADKIDPEKRIADKDRELLAQGAGNVVAGLIGALPVTAVIVRTSANVAAGGRTKASAVLHAGWLLLAVVLVPRWLDRIPLAALAAVLVLVGGKLAAPKVWKHAWAAGPSRFVPFAVTVVAIVLTDLLVGIVIGVVVGAVFVIRASVVNGVVYHVDGDHHLVRFAKDVSFLQKARVRQLLRRIPDGAHVTVDGSRSVHVDDDVVELVNDFVEAAPLRRIDVHVRRSPLALSPYFRDA